MKTIKITIAAVFGLALIFTIKPVMAEDPLKVGPDIYKLSYENDRVRIMEIDFKPGAKIGMHSHPDHFVYVTSGGTIRVITSDGKSTDVAAEPGQVLWMDAQEHTGENIGTTEIKAIVVELKEPKPAGK